LCKELQSKQKILEEENNRLAEEEAARRVELESSCEATIQGVKEKMELQEEQCLARQKENDELKEQYENFHVKYEEREKALVEQEEMRTKEMNNFRQRLEERKKDHLNEVRKTDELVKENERLMEIETKLRNQIQNYADSFNNVQQALEKSNHDFEGHKVQMCTLQKEMQELQEDNEETRALIKKGPQLKKQIMVLTKLLETLRSQKSDDPANLQTDTINGTSSSSSTTIPR